MTLAATMETVSSGLSRLAPHDRTFATSLMASISTRRGAPTERQIAALERIAQRITTPAPSGIQIGSMAAVVALFDRATASGLRRPKIRLNIPHVGVVKFSVAGNTARVPGSINVVTGSGEDQVWHGRITREGQFQPSFRVQPTRALLNGLRDFAANPAGTATAHGHLTGNCCFCARELTDSRSVTVGYGPICADHYGLPWGE